MREAGLEEAIRAAGGVAELARRIGVAQPSVSNWSRVPADRIVGVEAATGIPRAVLRPDLYSDATGAADDTAIGRAQEYALLAALLARAPDAALLGRLAARIDERPRAGDRCVCVGWSRGSEGRKIHTGSAVYSENGALLALGKATWVALK